MNIYLENDLLTLNSVVCHYGVPEQKWGKHDPNRRWQRHAVYAKGRPDPNAKDRDAVGIKRKSEASDFDGDTVSNRPKRTIEEKRARLKEVKQRIEELERKFGTEEPEPDDKQHHGLRGMSWGRSGPRSDADKERDKAYEEYNALERERRNIKLDLALSNASSKVKEKVKELVNWRTNENLPILKGIPGMYGRLGDSDPDNLINTLSAKREMISPSVKIGPLSITIPPIVSVHVINGVSIDALRRVASDVQTVTKLGLAVVARRKEPRDEKTGLHLKTSYISRDMSTDPVENVADDSRAVNPWFGTFPSGATNASNCIVAMEMRRRGYDVMAQAASFKISDPREKRSGISMTFKDARVNKVEDGNIAKALSKQPEGSRGVFFFNWKFTPSSGHAFYYSVNNGKITITDPQSGRTFTDALSNNEMKRLFAASSAPSYARLDDCDFILDQVKKAVF